MKVILIAYLTEPQAFGSQSNNAFRGSEFRLCWFKNVDQLLILRAFDKQKYFCLVKVSGDTPTQKTRSGQPIKTSAMSVSALKRTLQCNPRVTARILMQKPSMPLHDLGFCVGVSPLPSCIYLAYHAVDHVHAVDLATTTNSLISFVLWPASIYPITIYLSNNLTG